MRWVSLREARMPVKRHVQGISCHDAAHRNFYVTSTALHTGTVLMIINLPLSCR